MVAPSRRSSPGVRSPPQCSGSGAPGAPGGEPAPEVRQPAPLDQRVQHQRADLVGLGPGHQHLGHGVDQRSALGVALGHPGLPRRQVRVVLERRRHREPGQPDRHRGRLRVLTPAHHDHVLGGLDQPAPQPRQVRRVEPARDPADRGRITGAYAVDPPLRVAGHRGGDPAVHGRGQHLAQLGDHTRAAALGRVGEVVDDLQPQRPLEVRLVVPELGDEQPSYPLLQADAETDGLREGQPAQPALGVGAGCGLRQDRGQEPRVDRGRERRDRQHQPVLGQHGRVAPDAVGEVLEQLALEPVPGLGVQRARERRAGRRSEREGERVAVRPCHQLRHLVRVGDPPSRQELLGGGGDEPAQRDRHRRAGPRPRSTSRRRDRAGRPAPPPSRRAADPAPRAPSAPAARAGPRHPPQATAGRSPRPASRPGPARRAGPRRGRPWCRRSQETSARARAARRSCRCRPDR